MAVIYLHGPECPQDLIDPMVVTDRRKKVLAGAAAGNRRYCAFLASDRASYVNGTVVTVDGGIGVRTVS